MACVLILVHNNVSESAAVFFEHFGVLLKELYRICDHIVKVHCVGLFKALLVLSIGLSDFLKPEITAHRSQILVGAKQRILSPADCGKYGFVGNIPVVDSEVVLNLFNKTL